MESVPREVLTLILALLPWPDLKRVLQVSRHLQEVGEQPALWVDFPLILSPNNLPYCSQLLQLPRLLRLRRVRIQGCKLRNKHVTELLRSLVQEVTFGEGHDLEKDVELAGLSPSLLATMATKMRSVSFHSSLLNQLSEQQILAIVNKLNHPTSQTKTLAIFFDNNLSSLPASTLAWALASLSHLTLVFQKLNCDKYNCLFKEIGEGRASLQSLSLSGNDLSRVDPQLLGQATVRLVTLNLSDTKLTSLHLESLLSSLAQPGTRLRKLDISHNGGLRGVDERLVAHLVRLEEVSLKFTKLTPPQLETLLASLLTPARRLSCLSLVGTHSLARVPAPLLASLHYLTSCDLFATKLTALQLTALLSLPPTSHLRHLDLGCCNLSSLSSSLWPSLLASLSSLSLYQCHLSLPHQLAILSCLCSLPRQARLESLDLGGNTLGLEGEVLARARGRLRKLVVNRI